MTSYLEIWRPSGIELVTLRGERMTIGRGADNDVTIAEDSGVSRVHCVLELLASSWCLRDLGSRNGTHVQGTRVLSEHVLRANEEIRVGATRLVFRMEGWTGRTAATEAAEDPPELTRRERDVLLALCHTMLDGDAFREPASTRQMAGELFVTEAAVKQHLLHLYDKFGIEGAGERRRVRLANEAMRRGSVTVADLQRSRTAHP